MTKVYLNGEFIPLKEARISVLDRGFTFGDSVYEVLPVYSRHILRLKEHIERLDNSLAAIYMQNPMSLDQWQGVLTTLVEQDPAENQSIYLQVTRGVSERDHSINIDVKPTVFIMSKPLIKKDLSNGINAITCDDIRWKYCNVKATTLLPGILLRHQAEEKGAMEAILLRNDIVTEGAASNVFIVKDNVINTPVKDGNILPGITRDLVVELLNDANMPCNETHITKNELLDADEIWITSSTWEIVPVIKLDDDLVGEGTPGKTWKQTIEIYQKFKDEVIRGIR